ncbi:MAG: hypothetical protein AVDCRST_MAG19-3798 [uncultured Thermomicrobiales bacterium]|uniref:N-acetyltransferase domain-containing protein n=1 Tax=uncultured Thermomicrobiales bacterium TaxID=1645740 RepID=A0A6J4VL18_9BACT|nr:MAG: hypothetical protein AVDCRST_MAG19-3798 [uncultured Thermomicrobiales bacterium]
MTDRRALSGTVVRLVADDDREWVRRFLHERWGSAEMAVHGTVHRPAELPGFVAVREGEPLALLTYEEADAGCEIVGLDSLRPGRGVGSALLGRAEATARRAGRRRLWLVTTNDHLTALRFYQKRGFVLVALDRDAVTRARRLKLEIPLVGDDGIPLRDELDLETTRSATLGPHAREDHR